MAWFHEICNREQQHGNNPWGCGEGGFRKTWFLHTPRFIILKIMRERKKPTSIFGPILGRPIHPSCISFFWFLSLSWSRQRTLQKPPKTCPPEVTGMYIYIHIYIHTHTHIYRRRTNAQQLTCNIDLSCSFYYLFFSSVLLELKPFVLKAKVLGENYERVRKIVEKKCEKF